MFYQLRSRLTSNNDDDPSEHTQQNDEYFLIPAQLFDPLKQNDHLFKFKRK